MTTAVDLDRMHRALRTGDRWRVERRHPTRGWELVDEWNGSRRTLLQWCETHGIEPSRAAEAQLDLLPEATGFRDR